MLNLKTKPSEYGVLRTTAKQQHQKATPWILVGSGFQVSRVHVCLQKQHIQNEKSTSEMGELALLQKQCASKKSCL